MRLFPSLCRCARHSCLAKEDPDNDASTRCFYAAGRTGTLHERWPMRLIRPTLSTCCDGSQLLLGLPSLAGRLTNQGIPTAEPRSSVRMHGSAVNRSGPVNRALNLQRITSYRLPLLLHKRRYKRMPETVGEKRRSWGIRGADKRFIRNTILLDR